jgi:hypothetical protein
LSNAIVIVIANAIGIHINRAISTAFAYDVTIDTTGVFRGVFIVIARRWVRTSKDFQLVTNSVLIGIIQAITVAVFVRFRVGCTITGTRGNSISTAYSTLIGCEGTFISHNTISRIVFVVASRRIGAALDVKFITNSVPSRRNVIRAIQITVAIVSGLRLRFRAHTA